MARKTNKRFLLPILAILFIVIIISCVLFLFYTFSGNYITLYNDAKGKDNITTEDAKNANIIIINNLVLGGTHNEKWVSHNEFYEAQGSIPEFEVTLFSENKSYGKYKTASLKRYNNSVVYTTVAKENLPNKYIALSSNKNYGIMPGMTKLEPTKDDEKYVKEAIGSYDLINGSVKVTSVYATNINQASDKIICATSSKANFLGVYSAVVYVSQNTAHLVKYSYVRDTSDSDRWPVYSLEFVMDLNNEGKPEIILQETTGNDASYSVLELREENKFYEVLKTTVEI